MGGGWHGEWGREGLGRAESIHVSSHWHVGAHHRNVGSHAIRNGGGSEGVALLRVDKLAHGRQLVHAVHFVQRWGAVTVGRLRLHRGLFLK